MKKLTTLVLALMLLVALPSTAFAANPPAKYSSIPTEGTPAEKGIGSAEGSLSYASGAAAALDATGITIYSWRNQITEASSGYVKCYCSTAADATADKIQNDYILQQWDGSSWVTYSSASSSGNNTNQFTSNVYRYVALGYYYRIKTTHRAWLDVYYDQQVLYSSYIYVG